MTLKEKGLKQKNLELWWLSSRLGPFPGLLVQAYQEWTRLPLPALLLKQPWGPLLLGLEPPKLLRLPALSEVMFPQLECS